MITTRILTCNFFEVSDGIRGHDIQDHNRERIMTGGLIVGLT